jgi:uncharacterized protein (TIRG00374 family)
MKKSLLLIAKLAFSASVITWILQKTDLATIWIAIKGANLGLVIVAFLMFYLGYLIIARRQQSLLEAQNILVSIPFLLQSFAIGMFFSNLLPSTIGGDASRMYDVWRVGGSKSKAVSVILIDRFFGMFALVTFGFTASIFSSTMRDAVPGLTLYLGAILLAMGMVLWMVFGSGAKFVDWLLGLHLGPFGFIQRIASKIIDGFKLFRGKGWLLLKAIGWSLLLQLNVIVHFIIMTKALGIEVPITDMFVIIPVATILMLIPISINGIGLRDAIFVFMFGVYGVATESAVAFAWIALAMVIVQGVVGGVVFMLRRGAGPKVIEQ